jgi:hypothetical protein
VRIEESCRAIQGEVQKGLQKIQEAENSNEEQNGASLGEYEPIEEELNQESQSNASGDIEEEAGLDLEDSENGLGQESQKDENDEEEDEEIDENQLEEFLDQLDEMDQVKPRGIPI